MKFLPLLATVLAAALSGAATAESGSPLKISFGVSEFESGKEFPAPAILVRDGRSARVQFKAGEVPVDVSFSPRIVDGNVRLVIESHPQDRDGNHKSSNLCAEYVTRFDSPIGMREGNLLFRVVVSRVKGEESEQQPNPPSRPAPES